MVDVTLRGTKGSPLTHDEVDANFTNLKTAVEANETGLADAGGVNVYATIDDLPMSNNSNGDLALVSSTNSLYIFTNSGWYSIALINQTPTISGNEAVYELAKDGTATVVTLTGTDPEGIPITWSATTSGVTGAATVTNVDNVFTITPSTNLNDAGVMTVTFRASDGVNIGTATSEFTLAFLSALWKSANLSIGTSATNGLDNSTFIDRSTNAQTITPTGSPVQTAFHPYLENWSNYFYTNASYLSLTGGAVGSGDFTVEAWIHLDNHHDYNVLYDTRATATSSTGYAFGITSTGAIYLYTASGFRITTSTTIAINTWHHVALVRSGSTISIWINGTQDVNTYTSSATFSDTNTGIGQARTFTSGGQFQGYISNIRVMAGTALYTSTFTPPTEKLTAITNTVLLACQNNRFIDNSSNEYALTVVGTPEVSAFNPFGQESEYAAGENKGSMLVGYDGSAHGIFVDDESASGDIYPSDNDFTVSMWVYPIAGGAGSGALFIWGAAGIYSPFNIYLNEDNNTLSVDISTTGSSWNISSATTTISESAYSEYEWQHIEFSRSGTTIRLFQNGTQIKSWDVSTTALMTPTQDIGIGQRPADHACAGYISDVQYILGEALHTSDFTPPTSPVTSANSAMYLPMDNAGIFDKTGNATLVPNTSTATSTTQTKYATTSINFPTGSTLSVPYEPWMNISDQDFTMEMWVYPTDSSGGTLWSFGYSGDNRLDFGWQSSGGIRLLIETSNVPNTVLTSSDAVSTYLNSWVHIAVVRVGTGFTLYVNGTSTATGTSSLSIVEDTTDGWLFGGREFSSDYTGGNPSDKFTGYLENIQFFKGVAKYTSNFTVPDREQGRTYQAES